MRIYDVDFTATDAASLLLVAIEERLRSDPGVVRIFPVDEWVTAMKRGEQLPFNVTLSDTIAGVCQRARLPIETTLTVLDTLMDPRPE